MSGIVRDMPRSLDEVAGWFGALDNADLKLALLGLALVAGIACLVCAVLVAKQGGRTND